MADATKTTAHPIGHMTNTQASAVREKNLISLISFHSACEKLLLNSTWFSWNAADMRLELHSFEKEFKLHKIFK